MGVRRKLVVSAAAGWLLLFAAVVAAAPDDVPVTLDSDGDTGEYTSLALSAGGNPVITYRDDTNGVLRLLVCNDPNCADGDDIPVTLDADGSTGRFSSLVLNAAGNPVISDRRSATGDLRILVCNDPNCADGDDTPANLDTDGNTGWFPSMVLNAVENPVITYYDATNDDLRLVACNDPNCADGDDIPVTLDADGNTGWFPSLALGSAGNPVISYFDDTNENLRLLVCNDPNCADGDDIPVTVDADGNTGRYSSVVLNAAGNPVISYFNSTNRDLRLLVCNDPNCADGDDIPVTLDATGNTGLEPSMVLDTDGNPVISYYDATNDDLRLLVCNDPNCADGDDTPVTLDPDGNTGQDSSLLLDTDGNPVVSYYDVTNTDLRLLVCNDPKCAEDATGPTATITLAPGQETEATVGPVEFSITFDEPVTGFDSSDLVVGGMAGATSATLTGADAAYTATITSIPDLGTITLDLPAAAVVDAVGNDSLATILTNNTVMIVEPEPKPEPEIGSRELTGTYAGASGIEGSVSRMYVAVLNRQPDPGGHAYWIDRAANGLALRQMIRSFINTPEFINPYESLDNADFVDLLYLDLMDRVGDPRGVEFWNEQLDNGMDRSVVVLQFSESPEFKELTGTT